jgi:hypothetical protein
LKENVATDYRLKIRASKANKKSHGGLEETPLHGAESFVRKYSLN